LEFWTKQDGVGKSISFVDILVESEIRGHCLIRCSSGTEAQTLLARLMVSLDRKRFGCSVIRDREVNVFTVSYSGEDDI